MRHSVLIAALIAAAPVGLPVAPASAQAFEGQGFFLGRRTGPQAPWCAHLNSGFDRVEEDCSFNSFEHCRSVAMTLSSSFCTPNPAYDVSIQPVRRKKGDRQRR